MIAGCCLLQTHQFIFKLVNQFDQLETILNGSVFVIGWSMMV